MKLVDMPSGYHNCNPAERQFALEASNEKEAIRHWIAEVVKSTSIFRHPVALLPARSFLNLTLQDMEKMHEGLREANSLKFFDSKPDLLAFQKKGGVVLFFSYECLAWGTVGPNSVQLEAMGKAVREVAALYKIDLDSLLIWVDCLSVPQRDASATRAAIESIYAYACASDVMVVVCPDSVHAQTAKQAGRESVKWRFWCRVEQLAFCCQQGIGRMHLHGGQGLEPLPGDWMDSVCCVHDSDRTCCRLRHSGFSRCDRERAVVPLLALYHDVYTRAMSSECTDKDSYAWSLIRRNRRRMFPKSFRFLCGTREEQRELFGDKAEQIDRHLASEGLSKEKGSDSAER